MSIKIAIVDDHDLFLEGIKSILESIDDFNIVLGANNGEQFLNTIAKEENKIDILLLERYGSSSETKRN